jgi:Protein of unknown function (DUF1569)
MSKRTLAHEDCRAALVRRLRTLRPETPRRWGRMSAPQMICHLSDAFLMATGEKAVSATGGPLTRPLIKWTALYLPLPWPADIPTRPELDQLINGRCPGDFAMDVAEVERFIEQLAQRPVRGGWPPHPIFGSMSRRDWLRWGYLHVDHHLRQFGC